MCLRRSYGKTILRLLVAAEETLSESGKMNIKKPSGKRN
jgi:hypothetical protein